MAWSARGDVDVEDGRAAGSQSGSPACAAVTVQVPAPSATSAPSRTRQGPLVSKVTGRPESAVALSGSGSAPKTVAGWGPNAMRWSARAMSISSVTSGAGAQSGHPAAQR